MRAKIKVVVDVFMVLGVFLSMSLHSFGMGVHKIAGLLVLILFIVHNILNRSWYRGLLSGKYSTARIARTIINFVMILSLIGIIFSGVMLSKEMHSAAAVSAMTDARLLHLLSSYIACAAIALHIGFHLFRGKSSSF